MVDQSSIDKAKNIPRGGFFAWLVRLSRISDILLAPVCRLYEIREVLPRRADVVVGLSAGLCEDGSPSPMTRAVAERCASLFLEGVTAWLLFTGGVIAGGSTEAKAMRDVAAEMGVPPEKIILEEKSKRTHHHPPLIEPLLERLRANSIVVVSQHLHARRARAIFLKYYGNRLNLSFAKGRSGYGLTLQRRYASETLCLMWNLGTHLLAKLRGWA